MSQKNNSDISSPVYNLLINIIFPVTILNLLSHRLGENGPLIALLLALALPAGYGCYEVIKARKVNWLSAIGVVNVLLTGGLAVLHFSGIWFAIKEASLPLAIGIAVLISEWTPTPFVKMLFYNDKILQVQRISQRLTERQNEAALDRHLKKSTIFLACSFFLSAFLNFVLARRIFTEIPNHLSPTSQSELLNQQISQMTWLGFVVIAAPSTIITFAILWYTIDGIRKLTGLSFEQILASVPQSSAHTNDSDPPQQTQ